MVYRNNLLQDSRAGSIDSILRREGGGPSMFKDSMTYGGINSPTMNREFISSLFGNAMSSGVASQDLEELSEPIKRKLLEAISSVQDTYGEGGGVLESSSLEKGMQRAANDVANAGIGQYAQLLPYLMENQRSARQSLMDISAPRKSPFASVLGSVGSGVSSLAKLIMSIFG